MKKILFLILLLILGCTNNPCYKNVITEGFCNTELIGYDFNSKIGECQKLVIKACTIDSPFQSLEECKLACME